MPTAPDRLHFTGDAEADALIARDPMALLIGFALDQQVTVQKAFSGPLELRRRIGTLDPQRIADLDAAQLETAFRQPLALHRFPGAMAKRVRQLAEVIVRDHHGDARRVWTDATDGHELERRIAGLPGFGEMKVQALIAVLGERFGIRPSGYDEVAPRHPTLGDVDSPEALAAYQSGKRAMKAAKRAATS